MRPSETRLSLDTKPCIACGEDSPRRLLFSAKGYPILRCPSCGLGSTRVPPDFDPTSIYTRGYFQGEQEDGYVDYEGSRDELAAEFRNLLFDIASAGVAKGKLLEVGCAYGFFLDEARRSFEVSGVELSADAAAACRARGLDVIRHADAQFYARRGPFDVVAMLDVLEHLVDPSRLLQDLHAHTRPGALVVITTGDFGSFLARLMRRQWRLMTPPQHLWYFTTDAIQRLLHRFDFRVVQVAFPTKQVPVGLIAYQIARYLRLQRLTRGWQVRGSVPVNLHDAMRVFAQRV